GRSLAPIIFSKVGIPLVPMARIASSAFFQPGELYGGEAAEEGTWWSSQLENVRPSKTGSRGTVARQDSSARTPARTRTTPSRQRLVMPRTTKNSRNRAIATNRTLVDGRG